MATYTEIRDLFDNDEFRNRCYVATVIAANNLLSGTPTADDAKWASAVLASPSSEGRKAQLAVIAANSNLDIATILAASDAAIQSNVDAVIPQLVIAYNAMLTTAGSGA